MGKGEFIYLIKFPPFSQKETTTYCDFLFDLLKTEGLLKLDLFQKESICMQTEDAFSDNREGHFDRVASLIVYQFPL